MLTCPLRRLKLSIHVVVVVVVYNDVVVDVYVVVDIHNDDVVDI